jgi:hypothetical protein
MYPDPSKTATKRKIRCNRTRVVKLNAAPKFLPSLCSAVGSPSFAAIAVNFASDFFHLNEVP